MNADTTKTVLGGLLPLAFNPVVLTAIGIGGAVWAISTLFNDEDDAKNGSSPQKNRPKPFNEPSNINRSTVQRTVERLQSPEETASNAEKTRLERDLTNDPGNAAIDDMTTSDGDETILSVNAPANDGETEKKEMIRKAMSELGKLSGAARRKAKINRDAVLE